MTTILILLALAVSVWIWFATKPMTREEAIHRAQQAALKRHNRLVHGYWVERGKTIKPHRFCASLDENEPLT